MAAFYIEDATGEKYCFTVADNTYRSAFLKHARWRIGYMRNPNAETRKTYTKSHRGLPCFPLQVVCELDD